MPGQKAGQQSRNRIGVADSYGSQKGESEPTPGYSVFTKITSNSYARKHSESSFILIKDYTEIIL